MKCACGMWKVVCCAPDEGTDWTRTLPEYRWCGCGYLARPKSSPNTRDTDDTGGVP